MHLEHVIAVCALYLPLLACFIIAMPPTDRTNADLEAAHTRQHDADEALKNEPDADQGEHEDEAYDDDNDIYDDEEYLHLLLGLNGSMENVDREKTYTSPDSKVSPQAVAGSSGAAERPGFVGGQGAQYEDSLQPRKRSSGTAGTADIVSVSTSQPGRPRDIDAGVSRENSVGLTPSMDLAVAAEIEAFPTGMTTTGESVTGGLEQLASLPTDCPPAQKDDLANHDEGTQGESREGQGAAGSGHLQPCGRNVHVLARQPVHRGPSADLSGTSATSGQLASAGSESRDLGLALDGHVINGLNGHGQGHLGDTDNRIHNAALHRGNNYNIGDVDSNIDFPSDGENKSRSLGTNIHLIVTPGEQVDAVRPVQELHEDKPGELTSIGHRQPGHNATTGRHQTRDTSSNLLSPDTTNTAQSMTHAPSEASLSGAAPASQLYMSSKSHDITSPDIITTQRQAGSHIERTQDSTFTNVLTASISTSTASPTFSSEALAFQMPELWRQVSESPTSQPRSTDSWYTAINGHNRNKADMSVNILPTMTIVHEHVQETTKHALNTDNTHAKIEWSHTLKITSSTAPSLTPCTEDLGQSFFTDHNTTHTPGIAIVLPTPTYSMPSLELEISATPVVEIMSATITISTHGPSLEHSTIKVDNPAEDRTRSTTPDVAVASTWLTKESISPTNESTSPTNEFTSPARQNRPLSASSVPSPHLSTVAGDGSENQVPHTEPSQNSAGMDRLASETTVKPAVNQRPPENTTLITDPAEEMTSLLMELKFRMSWPDFCQNKASIRGDLVELLQGAAKRVDITPDQLQLVSTQRDHCNEMPGVDSHEISVLVYLVNKSRHVDDRLTELCVSTLQSQLSGITSSRASSKLISVRIYGDSGLGHSTDASLTPAHSEEEDGVVSTFSDPGVTIAVVLASVGGCYCLGVVVLQISVRCRGKNSAIPRFKHSFSITSSDSIQLTSVAKSRPNSGLFNPALDLTDQMEKMEISNPLNFIQLSKMCMNETKIHEEYQKIPHQMARLSVVPAGDEDKNRYANVLPLAHTRVRLVQDEPEPRSCYINANYVTGPNNASHYYIATQAPTEKTTADFWAMVWQQGCRVIVMLTQFEEDGQVRCASYWPEHAVPSAAQRHGHFLIELQQKNVSQEYIHSRLQINNLREIETREVEHLWYTCWPPVGVPEPISLVKLVLDTRPRHEAAGTPLVVHCSPGTGRTCTFIALDLCMRQFEERRVVDVMKTVHSIRQERAGAVQNKEQYTLLYNAVSEYAMMVVSPVISAASSATTLHALLQS